MAETIKEKKKGTVKWFNVRKGYGFIVSDDKDYFVHYTGIVGDGFKQLITGQDVTFEEAENEKGAMAVNVAGV